MKKINEMMDDNKRAIIAIGFVIFIVILVAITMLSSVKLIDKSKAAVQAVPEDYVNPIVENTQTKSQSVKDGLSNTVAYENEGNNEPNNEDVGQANSVPTNNQDSITSTPAPVVNTPTPVVNTPAPVVNAPAPVVNTPTPVAKPVAPVAKPKVTEQSKSQEPTKPIIVNKNNQTNTDNTTNANSKGDNGNGNSNSGNNITSNDTPKSENEAPTPKKEVVPSASSSEAKKAPVSPSTGNKETVAQAPTSVAKNTTKPQQEDVSADNGSNTKK
ncbi:MAG: hypothetical protein ACRC6T_00400 [Sarcina sp.]